jgi:hypothetical protein
MQFGKKIQRKAKNWAEKEKQAKAAAWYELATIFDKDYSSKFIIITLDILASILNSSRNKTNNGNYKTNENTAVPAASQMPVQSSQHSSVLLGFCIDAKPSSLANSNTLRHSEVWLGLHG